MLRVSAQNLRHLQGPLKILRGGTRESDLDLKFRQEKGTVENWILRTTIVL